MIPDSELDLVLDPPAARWDDAMPLGNGLLGALVWGDGGPLRLSIDRTDLWDLRPVEEWDHPDYRYATVRRWHAEGRHSELERLLEDPYNRPAPTRLPAGRLEVDLGGVHLRRTRLRLADAVGELHGAAGLGAKSLGESFVHAVEPFGLLRLAGVRPTVQVIAPAFVSHATPEARGPAISAGDLSRLGYEAPQTTSGPNHGAFVQEGWGGLGFAVRAAWRQEGGWWLLAWSIASGPDAGSTAGAHCAAALAEGWQAAYTSHAAWWKRYWQQSEVTVPDRALQRLWHLEQYRFGAASRRGAPPISLQGPWTEDSGQLPPWKGDYHHNLNTQLSYWPCYAANHLEEGLAFLDWLWQGRTAAEAWTRNFFGLPGLNVPMTVDLAQRQIGGWRQYTHSATTAAWLAHHFWLHWRYSGDHEFLRDRAWPWLRDAAVFIEAITAERNADGLRTMPLSSSPEIHDNRPEAWFASFTTYDLALSRWLMQATAALADELNLTEAAGHWRCVLSELPALPLAEDGRPLVALGQPLTESHRHFSHLMAIHPLGLIDRADGPQAMRSIQAALVELQRLGPSWWCGYSWAWLASLRARAGDGAGAAEALGIFAAAFISRSGFHLNGDQTGTRRYSNFEYRPFTLEGNFAAAAGLQEMLLNSHAGIIVPFPALPPEWPTAAFCLRAEGGFLVEASWANKCLHALAVTATVAGRARILVNEKLVERDLDAGQRWEIFGFGHGYIS